MKLVNGFDLMEFAKKYHYVLPAFNTTNLEMTYAIANGLMEANLPGYIQISSNNLRLSNHCGNSKRRSKKFRYTHRPSS